MPLFLKIRLKRPWNGYPNKNVGKRGGYMRTSSNYPVPFYTQWEKEIPTPIGVWDLVKPLETGIEQHSLPMYKKQQNRN